MIMCLYCKLPRTDDLGVRAQGACCICDSVSVSISKQHATILTELVTYIKAYLGTVGIPRGLEYCDELTVAYCDELLEDLGEDVNGRVRDTPVSCSKCEWTGRLGECHAGTEEIPWLCPRCNKAAMVNV